MINALINKTVRSNIITLRSFDAPSKNTNASQVSFQRDEINLIMGLYGQMVSKGVWKDYAISFLKDKAVFSIYRKASEYALYKIEKNPSLKNKQGQYSVIAPGGLILKRGHDLKSVLRIFDKYRFIVK